MKNNSLRVVVDTNVLVSALVFGGVPRKVMEILIEEATVVTSPEILTELRRIVHAKFPAFLEDLQRLEQLLKRDGVQVVLGDTHVTASRDPDDNKVIETAIAGACSYIISGDKDLLDLKQYEDIQIVTPANFLEIIQKG